MVKLFGSFYLSATARTLPRNQTRNKQRNTSHSNGLRIFNLPHIRATTRTATLRLSLHDLSLNSAPNQPGASPEAYPI